MKKIGILIVGFNRPILLEKRIRDVIPLKQYGVQIYVYLDGPRAGNQDDEVQSRCCTEVINNRLWIDKIETKIRDKNLGCDLHIPTSISETLEKCEGVIVIEDDVSLSPFALNEMILQLKSQSASSTFCLVSMSFTSLRLPRGLNIWRRSMYFSAWGYAVSRKFWQLHQMNQEKTLNWSAIENELQKSQLWRELSNRKKAIWRERFMRGNYDYQIQKTLFLNNTKSIAPLFRISDNEGHGDVRAVHTSHKMPRYLKRRVLNRKLHFIFGTRVMDWYQGIFRLLDSNTWGGDGYLSARGRTKGIRTYLRQLCLRSKDHGR